MPKKGAANIREDTSDLGPGHKAREAKAAAAAEKERKASAAKAKQEEEEWMDGADVKAMKRAEEARAAAEKKARDKAEKEALVKKEEEEIEKGRKLRGADKVAARKAEKAAEEAADRERLDAPALVGRGIDAAIAVMEVATNTAAAGAGAAGHDDEMAAVDRLATQLGSAGTIKENDAHPEKRMKAAWARYFERELPLIKKEYPSLKLSQHKEMLWRNFQKSDDNPVYVAEKAAMLAKGGVK